MDLLQVQCPSLIRYAGCLWVHLPGTPPSGASWVLTPQEDQSVLEAATAVRQREPGEM